MRQADALRSSRDEILRTAQRHGVRRVRVFGSIARGEARPNSDLDLLIEMEPGRSLLDQIGFQQEIEELLSCKVDVVVEGGISPYLKDRILAEATPL